MTAHRILIRGGYVLTMDPRLGDLPAGDVLVEDDRIAAIARDLPPGDAEVIDAHGYIVMPGMVDTHRHTWQTQMRALCANWTLNDYFNGIRLALCRAYTAEDVYIGNYLGALEAVNAGVTTILDFSHCNNTPMHADAALDGLAHAGIRAVFCYGFFDSGAGNSSFVTHDRRVADLERISATLAPGGLLTIGVALTEVGLVPWADTVAEIEAARRVGGRIAAHTGCVWGSTICMGIREMDAQGLLGPDQVHIHCNTLGDDEWAMLARANAKVSISPETELNMGMGTPVFGKCRQFGIRPTLSCDIVSLNSGDLFTQMRLGLAYARFLDNDVINRAGAMPDQLSYSVRDALEWVTVNGAQACGLESKAGSLTIGKQADIVVLGGDSFTMRPRPETAGSIVFQANSHDVRDVMIAGKLVKRGGALVNVDLPRVLDRAEKSASAILSRVHASAPSSLPATVANQFAALARR